MNETGLRAPGTGFSLKSEKEKSKVFLTSQRLYATVVQITAQTRFGERFIERGRFRGGQQALEWWRTAEAERAEVERATAGPETRQLHEDGSGAGRSRVSSRGPSTGLPLPALHPRPPGRRLARHTHPRPRSRAGTPPPPREHAASPSRPAQARPLSADARRPPAARGPGHAGRTRGGGLAAVGAPAREGRF